MITLNERYIVDSQGKRVAVVLDIAEYNRLLEELEELEDLRAYDEAQAAGETPVPIEQAIRRIESQHRSQ
ncbi:MAG: type II toxin-antitoxin system Phd/YefM family antitoxin [Anaerolineae bacterium]